MTTVYNPPPITQPLLYPTGLPQLQWVLFFEAIYNGDPGTTWTPIPTGLTQVGTAVITGVYYKSGGFIDFYIYIVPATNTSSTAGTTYFDLPFDVQQDSGCFAVSGNLGSTGMVNATQDRVYPASWSALTTPVTIQGRVLAK